MSDVSMKASADRMGGWLTRYSDWIMGVGVIGLMITLLMPLPPAFLDVLHHLAQHIPVHLYVPQPTPQRSTAATSSYPTRSVMAVGTGRSDRTRRRSSADRLNQENP